MSVFNIKTVDGCFEGQSIRVAVISEDETCGFMVALIHRAGGLSAQLHFDPEQSRALRKALEDAEAKAEILTAAV